jgi:catechol 2,3-dioxygenase-like lactoylglutathione lyase family enzyme
VRGGVHHIDFTVREPAKSAAFYDAVLGFMGYRRSHEDERGIDWALATADGTTSSIGIVRAQGGHAARSHDRYSPGLHHLAWRASSCEDVDRLYALLVSLGARILDAPADYPQYGAGYYAVFFADPDGLKLEYVFEP